MTGMLSTPESTKFEHQSRYAHATALTLQRTRKSHLVLNLDLKPPLAKLTMPT